MIRYLRVRDAIVLISDEGIALPVKISDGLWCLWGKSSDPVQVADQQLLDEIYELGAVEGVFCYQSA